MRRPLALAAATAVLGGLAMGPARSATTAGSMTFATSLVASEQLAGEPRVFVDAASNHTYVVAPNAGPTTVWTSGDGGSTWGNGVSTSGGGGDSDIAVDGSGNVWVNDLLGAGGPNSTIPISVSTDHASHFSAVENLTNDTGPTHDRAWMAASGSTVVVSARNGSVADGWVLTTDGKGHVSSTKPVTVASGAAIEGPMISPSAGTFITIYGGTDGNMYMAESTDNGASWTSSLVAAGEASFVHLFPTIASDGGSPAKLYAAWSTNTADATDVIRASVFNGTSWSAPVDVSDASLDVAGDNKPALFPWVVATPNGADISYVIATQSSIAGQQVNPVAVGGLPNDVGDGADLGGPTTQWDLVVAQTLDKGATWQTSTAVSDFHTGSICTAGLFCLGPQNAGFGNVPSPYDRRDLDFIGSALDATGHLVVPFDKDRTPGANGTIVVGDLVLPWTDLTVAVQNGGSSL